jgi:hypothetical protein
MGVSLDKHRGEDTQNLRPQEVHSEHICNPSYLQSGGLQFLVSPGKQQDLISKAGVVMHTCHPSYVGGINRIVGVQASLCVMLEPNRKITKSKRAGGMAHMIECLPSKCKGLS